MSSFLASFSMSPSDMPVGMQPLSTGGSTSSSTPTPITIDSPTSTSTSPTSSFTSNAALYLYTFLELIVRPFFPVLCFAMSSQSTINPMTGTVVSPVNLSYSALVATLVLLLAVSSAIVTRSLVLRRRHQRLLEEAFRAGTWVPHRNDPRSDRRQQDIGEKPKLWEAWLQSDEEGDGGSGEKGKWDDIMPVCAAYIDQSPSALPPTSSENAIESQLHPPRFLRPFPRRPVPSLQSVTASPMAVQAPSSSSSSPIRSSSPAVHVTVLIAMPTPIQKLDRHEDGPPVVEIGVIVVGVLDDDESPSRNVS